MEATVKSEEELWLYLTKSKAMMRTLHILKIFISGFIFLLCIAACKKLRVAPEEVEELVSPTTGTRKQLTLDSIFLYARQVYLWNDALPDYNTFNPRVKYEGYGTDLTAFQTELFDISQTKINPTSNLPYENSLSAGNAKYSYLVSGVMHGGSVARTVTSTVMNPVLLTSLLNVGTSNVGYVALSSFPKLSEIQSHLDEAFTNLASAKPTDLIIDLRSNGGGYVQTAEYVANLIVPSALNGKVMYTEQFNSRMQQGKALILRHQPYLDENGDPVIYNGRQATMADVDFTEAANTYKFSKKGYLETVKNVYFIVSDGTASASELLISSLKPYLPVKLIGSKTYGKPVGFFGVVIDKYTVYMSSFLIKNAAGFSDYFNGMSVDITAEPDGRYGLGNPNETCLNKVLAYIQSVKTTLETKVKVINNLKSATTISQSRETTSITNAESLLNGMIEQRMRLKL